LEVLNDLFDHIVVPRLGDLGQVRPLGPLRRVSVLDLFFAWKSKLFLNLNII
jgi:hypothetical protein